MIIALFTLNFYHLRMVEKWRFVMRVFCTRFFYRHTNKQTSKGNKKELNKFLPAHFDRYRSALPLHGQFLSPSGVHSGCPACAFLIAAPQKHAACLKPRPALDTRSCRTEGRLHGLHIGTERDLDTTASAAGLQLRSPSAPG